MRKHLKIFGNYFRLNLSSALEYRASFLTQAFGMVLNNAAFVFFWWIAFEKIGGRIAGYSFRDVMFIWAAVSSAFGVSKVLFANASNLTQLIVTGELDAFLLQPCNTLLSVICAKTSLSAYGDFFYGIALIALTYGGNLAAWGWFLYGVTIGALVLTGVTLAAHSLTFFWGDASAIGGMAAEFMLNFSLYPEKIYAPAIRVIMYTILPAGLMAHLPLRLLNDFSPLALTASVIGAALFLGASAKIFYAGLKRYESGNAISMKA